MVKLGDIFKITSGGTPSKSKPEYYENGTIQWVRTGDLKDKYINRVDSFITEEALRKSSAKLFPVDTVLIAMYGATIGACSILSTEAATNQACAAFLPNKEVDSLYLYYFLYSKKNDFIKMGVGGAQPNISATLLKGVYIPLPPLETQKQVAKTLDTAAELLAMRNQQFAELDSLIQSTFYDMFGDPVANEKGWEFKRLGDLVSKLGDGIHGTPIYSVDGEYYFINGNNLSSGAILVSDTTKRVNVEEYKKHKRDLNSDTMLVSINGTLGNVAFYNNEKIVLGKSACYFNVYDFVNKKYLYYILKSDYFLKYASDSATGSTIKNVSLKSMREFPVPYPPSELQNQFATIVTKIEEQKALVKKAIDETQYLFDSLMSEYFD